jgi:purine nucleoside permease
MAPPRIGIQRMTGRHGRVRGRSKAIKSGGVFPLGKASVSWLAAAVLAMMATVSSGATTAVPPIPVRVVVVATFELGEDTGDTPGEFQYWVERLPLMQTLPFPAGQRALRYNPQKHILGVVVGSGSINSSASVMALGLDPRFDLSHAYWIVAGIAGINPNRGSVGSAAWAEWVIDRDLTHEIDAREIPADWTTGLVPLMRSRPFQNPLPDQGIFSPIAYHLNPDLVNWAYQFTAGTALADSADLQGIRAPYTDQAEARRPPHVMKGDEMSANDWWLGALMNREAEESMTYWTGGQGVSVTTAMEDCGVIHSIQMLSRTKRADERRVLVLRTAANYTAPSKGQTAAELLASESSSDSATHLSAYLPSLEAAFRVGSPVVEELSSHWDRYKSNLPRVSH